MGITELTNDNFDVEVLAEQKPVLIDFWADWCGPCKMLSPVVDEIAEEMGDKIKVCKVNVDAEANLALSYQIISIPTLVFMKKGEFKQRMVGVQTKEDIVAYLNTLL